MHVFPDVAQVKAWAEAGHTQCAVYCELMADLETPVSAFLKVTDGERERFLLESVDGGEQIGRYSFIGCAPRLTIRGMDGATSVRSAGATEDFPATSALAQLERLVVGERAPNPAPQPELPAFTGGAVGYLSYETVLQFERLPSPERRPLPLPDSSWMVVDCVLVFDHVRHTIKIVSTLLLDDVGSIATQYAAAEQAIAAMAERLARPLPPSAASSPLPRVEDAPATTPVRSNMSSEDFAAMVERSRDYIRAGDIFQVVLSQRFERPTTAEPFAIYRALRSVNPSPYMYYIELPEAAIVGASPEMLVRVERGTIKTRPIAGTRRRGRDAADEERMAAELLGDEKERAEHLMLVDLGRNDVGRVAKPGTVAVPQFMQIERYSHVMHLVSEVTGELDTERYSPLDALRACFPAGTLSGAPKVRAMEIIAELEPEKRGTYGGAVGYLAFGGQSLDTAITIRTMVVHEGVAHVQAGAGVVADSDPRLEELESRNKASALLRAIDVAEALDAYAVGA